MHHQLLVFFSPGTLESVVVLWMLVLSISVYSLFAALEYVVVVSNIAFHATLYWDFGQHYVLGMAHSEVLCKQGTL